MKKSTAQCAKPTNILPPTGAIHTFSAFKMRLLILSRIASLTVNLISGAPVAKSSIDDDSISDICCSDPVEGSSEKESSDELSAEESASSFVFPIKPGM